MSKTFFPKLSTARWRTSYLGSYGDKERISSIFRSWLFLLPCIFIIIACDSPAVSTNSDNAEEPKPPWAPNITSMEPVTFTLQPKNHGEVINLNIPKAYIYKPGNLHGSTPGVIYLQTGLPDLRPQKPSFSLSGNVHIDEARAKRKKLNGMYVHIFNDIFTDSFWKNMEKNVLSRHEEKANDRFGLSFYLETTRGEHCFKNDYPLKEAAGKCFPRGYEHYISKNMMLRIAFT